MRNVLTKQQFVDAIKSGECKIICHGEIADEFKKQLKRKQNAKRGGIALALVGLLAAPFTLGTSLTLSAAGLTAAGLTISLAELAVIAGAGLAAYGIHNKCKVEFKSDGTVVVEPMR